MKKIIFELELEVHKDLNIKVFEEYLNHYLFNQEAIDELTASVIGEKEYPNHFGGIFKSFGLKKTATKKKK
tara:strand:- start:727 stop:939 length:213 start_codon:yes stop_codon:yes gene_type:complete